METDDQKKRRRTTAITVQALELAVATVLMETDEPKKKEKEKRRPAITVQAPLDILRRAIKRCNFGAHVGKRFQKRR
jgi:hypothetical protein